MTIRRVRRSHRGSTAKNPSGRHRSQVELVIPNQVGVVGPFRPRVLAAANARLRYGCPAHTPRPRHFTETTARSFLPHPRHRRRPLRSRTFAAGLRPPLNSASAVGSATWWQAAQLTLRKSSSHLIRKPLRVICAKTVCRASNEVLQAVARSL